jgi:hypothetical protein
VWGGGDAAADGGGDDDDDDCCQISHSLSAIGIAPNSVERKSLITSTTLCPFE